MNKEILKKLEDMEFAKKLISIEQEDQVVELFSKEGIKISGEDIDEIKHKVQEIFGRLQSINPSEIEKVVGGSLTQGYGKLNRYFSESVERDAVAGKYNGSNPEDMNELGKRLLGASDKALATMMAATAVTSIAAYAGGKFAWKKGKQWWDNRKK